MHLEQYQELASSTAVYPVGQRVIYPVMGLVGEIGEIANKVKKIYRDDGGQITEAKRDELKKELGDVCWYIAATASDMDITLMNGFCALPKFIPRLEVCVLRLASTAGTLAERVEQGATTTTYTWPFFCKPKLRELCLLCNALAHHIGVDFGDVLQSNIDKLLSRKERGTLQGSGDNR